MTHYFETDIALNWAYYANQALENKDRKKDSEPSPRILVYCKALETEDCLTVTLVNADTSQPFIMYMKNVSKSFLTGTKEIQPSFFLAKHEFVTNLTK